MHRSGLLFLSSAVSFGLFFVGCSSSDSPATGGAAGTGPMGQAGSSSMAGAAGTTSTSGGSTATAGTTGTSGTTGVAGSGAGAGTGGSGVAGTSAGGMSGAGGGGGSGGGGPTTGSMGCGMDPPGDDSQATFIKHDIEVTGVDPAFVQKYAINAGRTYNWTHRNYYLRLPTNYDPTKSYPITIGGSGCGGSDTVGSEGGYSPLGTKSGETESIQVALSYVLSSAANADCGGAVFADGFANSPEVQYLQAVIKDVQTKYCTDPKKVFLSGYSSGAFEATTLGCSNANALRGIGIQIGGGLRQHAPMPCTGKVAAMFVVGNQDTANPIGPLQQPLNDSLGSAPARDEVLMRNGCTGTATAQWDANYPACLTYTGCPKEYPVVWCPIDSGHTPDAADPAVGKYRYEAMWKFWSSLPAVP